MGTTTVVNNLNYAMNMALCVWLSYYEGNNIAPRSQIYWNKVGAVWFTISIVPWSDKDNTFCMGCRCSATYYGYVNKAKQAAKDIENFGVGQLGHLQIIGRNLTYNEAEDRLMQMVYWGDGFYVSDKTITIEGGPASNAVDYKTIDISAPFDEVKIYIS